MTPFVASAGLCLAAALALAGSLGGCASDDASSMGPPSSDAGTNRMLSADGPVYVLGGGSDGGSGADGPLGGGLAAFSSGYIDFGAVECGGLMALQTLTVVNNGSDPLAVSATTTGTAYAVSPKSMMVPGGGLTADLTITATVPGSATAGEQLTGSLDIVTSDPSQGSFIVPLTVTPTGATITLKSPPATIAFPASEVGQSADQLFILANSGNGPATVVVGPPSYPRFSLIDGPDAGATLNWGDTSTWTAQFMPQDTTMVSATSTVSVTGTTCGTNVSSISFSGEGAYGAVTGWPTAPIDFGLATCGGAAPAPLWFQLTNNSSVDALITSVSLTPPMSGFTTDVVEGKFIPAGGTRRINVTAPSVQFCLVTDDCHNCIRQNTARLVGDRARDATEGLLRAGEGCESKRHHQGKSGEENDQPNFLDHEWPRRTISVQPCSTAANGHSTLALYKTMFAAKLASWHLHING